MNSSSSRFCKLHCFGTQLLVRDVTDVLVVFSCPLDWFFFTRDSTVVEFKHPIVPTGLSYPYMLLQATHVGSTTHISLTNT